MRLVQFERSGRVVAPDHPAAGGVQGVHVDSLAGPNAARKVNQLVHHYRSAACGQRETIRSLPRSMSGRGPPRCFQISRPSAAARQYR